MKKHLVLALAALSFGVCNAYAQADVVKEAQRAQKEGRPAEEVLNIIAPAFSNDETSSDALTYYIPGKALFSEFDNLFGLKQFGKLPEGGDALMARDLLKGYDMYVKVLSLDTIVDAKGKTKTKYSKDVVNTVTGHVNDFNNGAIALWDQKDYNGAYKCWDIYTSMYSTLPFSAKLTAPSDTLIGEIYYNQALAAWQADSLQNALKAFSNARKKGYNKKQLYDFALAVATSIPDQNAVLEWATEGKNLYGAEDPNYVGNIINIYLQNKDFDKAFAAIDEAIASDPNNAQYYFVKGVLYENKDDRPMAKTMYKKAIDLNPENVSALTQYGASLCQEAYVVSDAAPTNLNAVESKKYFDEKIRPLFEEASQYLEKAYQLDNDNMDALRYLENIYYNLGDEAKQNDVRKRMM